MTRSTAYMQAAADLTMIQDLVGRSCWELDHGSPQHWAALFAQDGVLEAPKLGLWVRGTHALTAFATDLRASLQSVHHVTTNHVVDVSGDTATGRCYLNEFAVLPDSGLVAAVQGWYEDDYTYSDGAWRIAHRRIFLMAPELLSRGEIATHYADFFNAATKYRQT